MVGLRLVPTTGAPVVVSQDVSVVGREPGCEVFVNDGSVSRRHARIERRGAAYFVVDEGSANGTFLDSQRVADALLRPGQEVRFGAVAFRVEISGGASFENDGTIIGGAPMMAPPPPLPRPPAPGAPPAYAPPPPPPSAAPAYPPPPRPVAPPAPPAAVPPPPPPVPPASVRPARPGGSMAAAASAPPARTGRSAWFWVALGCGGLLLLMLLVGAGIGLLVYKAAGAMQAPVDEVKAQLAEVKGGNLDAAYARLAPAYQADVSKEEFQAFTGKHASFAQNADTTFNNRSIANGTASISGSLKSASGESEDASFKLVKQGDAWKVTAIEVGGESPENSVPDTGTGQMAIEPLGVQKREENGTLRVTLRIQVTGFKVRPEGDHFAIELTEDVETTGPDGVVVDGLTRSDVERFAGSTSLAKGAFASFTTNLTMDPKSTPGSYAVKLTVRDQVGGGSVSHVATVELP
jgi:hypothetical protein